MSGASSSAAGWSSLLEPVAPPTDLPKRPDDPRMGEVIEFWNGDMAALRPGRAVIVGFPEDEGVRRNGGRVGAAEAPREIRGWLWRLTPWHPGGDWATTREIDLTASPPLDLGDLRISGKLEQSQEALGLVIAELLKREAVPIVIGGGHETAYGHYLGYVGAGKAVGVINVDAHLDVRPLLNGLGHSGSPFRQMLEHPTHPLPGPNYICLGVQPGSVGREHWIYAESRGCVVHTETKVWGKGSLSLMIGQVLTARMEFSKLPAFLTIDADAFRMTDVPGVSAPNVNGFWGAEALMTAQVAGTSPYVCSFELVEINPSLDRDGQSARWAALVVWNFLIGLAVRGRS
jgi:formiminoglutamase